MELKKELDELRTLIKEFFEFKQRPSNFYAVDPFVNLDTELYKRYEEIQKKFSCLEKLYEKEKTEHQNSLNTSLNRNQTVLENVIIVLTPGEEHLAGQDRQTRAEAEFVSEADD